MTALRELQQAFAHALSGDGNAVASVDPLIVRDVLAVAERIDVYRNNVRAAFLKTMLLGFPATSRLVGPDYFRQLARAYQDKCPSRSGNLQHVGSGFEAFLADRFEGSRFEYLADVAAIEWAYQEVLVAAEHPPFDVTALAAVPEAELGALRPRLHPAARLVRSRFPLTRIWRANRDDTLDATQIDLDSGGETILLLRRDLDVEVHRLAAADVEFLAALLRGQTLAEALDAATKADAATDPAPIFAHYVALGVIAGVAGPGSEPADSRDRS